MTNLKEEKGMGLESLARTALGKVDPATEEYYKLKGMIDALDLAQEHGVVVEKGSPFYGMTEHQLGKEIDEIIASQAPEEVPEEIRQKEGEDPLRDLAQQAREFATSLKKEKHLPISWQAQMIHIIDLADDLETSLMIGQRERSVRLAQDLEVVYDKYKNIFGNI